jgi:hypothetical protein
MFPTAGPLGFPIGTASRMLVVKVDLRLKRSMSARAHLRHVGMSVLSPLLNEDRT